jgi:tripartite-type tricarboxylate transporter receptor subunit TctC
MDPCHRSYVNLSLMHGIDAAWSFELCPSSFSFGVSRDFVRGLTDSSTTTMIPMHRRRCNPRESPPKLRKAPVCMNLALAHVHLSKLLAVLVLILPPSSFSQEFPTRPITIYVAAGPGSGSEATIRRITTRIGERRGWTFLIEPKPGAGGTIAALALKSSAATGYTLLYSHSGSIVQDEFVQTSLPFNAKADFKPITGIADVVSFLAVPAALPVTSFKELADYSKKKTGGINYASYGAVTEIRFGILARDSGLKGTSVAYKSAPAALADLLAGRIDMLFTELSVLEPFLNDGKIRALGVTSRQRFEGRIDVPTFLEQKVRLTESFGWWGLYAPIGTPSGVIRLLHAEFTKALDDPDIRNSMIKASQMPIPMKSPEEFSDWISADRLKTQTLARELGIGKR